MQTNDRDVPENVWAAWLILIVLFMAFVITTAANAIIAPQDAIGTRSLFVIAVGTVLSGIGFVSLANGSARIPNPRLRNFTLAIVYACALAVIVSLALAFGLQI